MPLVVPHLEINSPQVDYLDHRQLNHNNNSHRQQSPLQEVVYLDHHSHNSNSNNRVDCLEVVIIIKHLSGVDYLDLHQISHNNNNSEDCLVVSQQPSEVDCLEMQQIQVRSVEDCLVVNSPLSVDFLVVNNNNNNQHNQEVYLEVHQQIQLQEVVCLEISSLQHQVGYSEVNNNSSNSNSNNFKHNNHN
ncbi:hypothetical protein SBY92_001155 [Candida maltosa Xu316]